MRFFVINLLLLAAFTNASVVFAETSPYDKLNNSELSDNLDTTQRLIIRFTYIKELALNNLKETAPAIATQLDNCLELVKQIVDNCQNMDAVSQAASIVSAASAPKIPLISPLPNSSQGL